jgi:dGTPase
MLYSTGDRKRLFKPISRIDVAEEPYRTEFRRDFARLVHSPAFRRLQGKTQLFPGAETDFFRNRLTHSLEVAQIAKSIAIKINSTCEQFSEPNTSINLDLIEFAGLAHDLGHPTFGHNGEAALDECMRQSGGFEGNAQTFHILAKTEKKDLPNELLRPVEEDGTDCRIGLNLTFRSLAAILKYDKLIPICRLEGDTLQKGVYYEDKNIYSKIHEEVFENAATNRDEKRVIECDIMDIADDIAYSTYDLEDTFKAGFLGPLQMLSSNSDLLYRVAEKVKKSLNQSFDEQNVLEIFLEVFGDIEPRDLPEDAHKLLQASSVFDTSTRHMEDGYVRTKFTSDLVSRFIDGVSVKVNEHSIKQSQVVVDPKIRAMIECLKHFTFEATIMSPRLRVSEQRGKDVVRKLFETLASDRGYLLMPADFRNLYELLKAENEKQRVVCDFIAGMTDRYAVEFYGRIFSEDPQTIFKPL